MYISYYTQSYAAELVTPIFPTQKENMRIVNENIRNDILHVPRTI